MTIKLVASMSFVLVVCLALFALLIDESEERVMDELSDTVSSVGRATLDAIGSEGAAGGAIEERTKHLAGARIESEIVEVRERKTGGSVHAEVVVVRKGEGGRVVVRGGSEEKEAIDSLRAVARARLPRPSPDEDSPLSIFVHKIITESDSGALVMKIPAIDAGGGADSAGATFEKGTSEIRVAFSTADYDALFASTRRRLLLLFACVLATGIVLSVWLARRFTRPIRSMDRALGALGRGDLEARVEVKGNDELARLGRAFNGMADSLAAARERERRLVRSEKLTALGRLAAGVAHDVRNPIHSVGLTLQHIEDFRRLEDTADDEELNRSISIIRSELRRVDRLVASFLRFAQNEPMERQKISIESLMDDVAALIEERARRSSIRIEIDTAPSLPELSVDAEAIRTSVLNLALNSIDAMPEGGELRFSWRARGDEVELEVSDTGRGISEEHLQHIFDFGWTSRDDGHGLGLAIAHQIVVEQHGGRIDARSRVGEGTKLTLVLPISSPEKEASL
ncbi:MAG: hypothetical protein CME06_10925 [Gemmatimonadetes bacterium]|nr:hypothetical protein [Gemmatimonadota bacterium]